MNPAKIDPISITTLREKGVESVIDWFEQHKQSFYTLGLSYLRNQQQMEELFYRSIIKVQKELPRFNNKTSFETWVTSSFIQICRELSNNKSIETSEESDPRQDLFKALDQLKQHEREALVLTYIKGISKEETAYLLQISEEKMKEHLFSGIQLLRKIMGYGSSFNGCKEYHKNYIDYLERTLDRPKKIDFEIHIYHCRDCQEDLATFQEVMLKLLTLTERIEEIQVPSGVIENVRDRLVEEEMRREQKYKKLKKNGIVFVSVFVLVMGIGFFTGAFTNLYYALAEEDQELRAFLQQDLGERLNLEAESNGVKIKIKSAIADEVQTLVFYEIEDTNEDNQYVMNYHDGVFVENEHEIMSRDSHPRYYPPDIKSDDNNEKKNVYHGKISLLPLRTDNETIKLKITKLQKLIQDSSEQNHLGGYGSMEFETGEWNFEIPVTKKPSFEYELRQETEVEGIPVRFNKLTIAPTTTILQYSIIHKHSEKRIGVLNFDSLEVNNKKAQADLYGSSINGGSYQAHFDPLFEEKPKEVKVQLESVHLSIDDQKNIELDASQEYPQTFEYAGSTISIDKVEAGQPANVVISNHDIENRQYEMLHFDFMDEGQNMAISSIEMDSEGVLIDKHGKQYDMKEIGFLYEEIDQPRYFLTVQRVRIHSYNTDEEVIPKKLQIWGYNTTKYLDTVVKISLNEPLEVER